MHSSRFKVVTSIVTLFLAALLVLVIVLTLRFSHPVAVVSTSSSTAASGQNETTESGSPATDSSDATQTEARGEAGPTGVAGSDRAAEQVTVPLGGFSYAQPDKFTVTVGDTSATLTGQSPDDGMAPIFLLSGGESRQFVADPAESLDEMFDQFVRFFAEEDNFSVGDVNELTVDSAEARSVELLSQDEGEPFAGRIVMAQPGDDSLFVMTGIATTAQWNQSGGETFEMVLGSVTLLGDDPTAIGAAFSTGPSSESNNADSMATGRESALTPESTLPPTATPTSTATATPTSIPTSQPLPTPEPGAQPASLPASYANANFIRELTATNSAIWAATEGGVVAWNRSGGLVTFTSQKGLGVNHFSSGSFCPLPGLGIVFGTDGGLQIFDARNGTWNMLTSANSAMSFDDVSTVRCSEEEGFLTVGYRRHGIDFYDTSTNAWSHIDQNDGLASDFVDHVAVIGDREEIWSASGFGLSVLDDGRSIRYSASNSPLTSNQINMLVAGPDDAAWIVAPDAIHRVRNQQWTSYSADTADGSFPDGTLSALAFESATLLWIGTADGAVCRFDLDRNQCTSQWKNQDGMALGAITSMIVDDGAVYYATAGNGMSRYDESGWQQREVPGEVLLDNNARSIAQDARGLVWVAGLTGVQQLHPIDPIISRELLYATQDTPLDSVEVIAPDRIGGVWFGGLGAAFFDGEEWTAYTTVDGLAGSIVQAIELDLQRRVWLGTKTGLSIWNGETFFNLTQENGLPNDNILALLAAGDSMWIGSNGGGLYQFRSNQVRIFSQANIALPSDTVTALARGSDGSLLVGTDRGLVRFRDESVEEFGELPPVDIRAVVSQIGDDEQVWVATNGDGTYHYDGENWTQWGVNSGQPSLSVSSLLLDSFDTVWIGGESGGISRIEVDR